MKCQIVESADQRMKSSNRTACAQCLLHAGCLGRPIQDLDDKKDTALFQSVKELQGRNHGWRPELEVKV